MKFGLFYEQKAALARRAPRKALSPGEVPTVVAFGRRTQAGA